MNQDLAVSLAALVRGVPHGRAAFLMDSDGMVVGSFGDAGAAAEALAGEYGMVLREAQGLAEARGWGALRTFVVSGATARLAFGAVPGHLVVGLVGGRQALVGLLRRAVESAAPGLGALQPGFLERNPGVSNIPAREGFRRHLLAAEAASRGTRGLWTARDGLGCGQR